MNYSSRFFLYAPFVLLLALATAAGVTWWMAASKVADALQATNGHEIAPGVKVRILPTDVAPALEAALQTDGAKRTETQRFIGDRYDRFFFTVSQLQAAIRSAATISRPSSSRSSSSSSCPSPKPIASLTSCLSRR